MPHEAQGTAPGPGVEPCIDTAWGIEFCPGENGNYWANQWRVATDDGNGSTIAVFEYPEHAIAFVERCGPEGSRLTDD